MDAAVWASNDDEEFTPRRVSGRNVKLAEQVARDIADTIFHLELGPGAKLPPERAMLEQFGVSRGTLREALRILEVQGLLIMKVGPAGGPVVAAMNARDFQRMSSLHYKAAGTTVQQLWQARVEIEPGLARLAAEQGDPAAMEELNTLLATSQRMETQNDTDFLRFGSEIHRAIARASGNPILDLVARSLGEMTAHINSAGVFANEHRSKVHRDHQMIVRAVIAGNANRAEKLMRTHMDDMLTSQAERFPGGLGSVLPYII
jgi:GntR family transcriptional regulator, transcriptional repressor for pyruvate dehydrogenase complex